MNLDSLHDEIVTKLTQDLRPLVKLSSDDVKELKKLWQDASESDTVTIHKVLCILDNTWTFTSEFDQLIIKNLSPQTHKQTIIFTLSVATKHIISFRQRNGDPVPEAFIDRLGELLGHKDPEVLEWTLRAMASLGRSGRRLKEKLIEHRPGLSAIFNVHKRNAQEIIDLILRTWQGP